jgi:hypothetical protein
MEMSSILAEMQKEQSNPAPTSHPFSVPDLRLFAYKQKFGETVPQKLVEHLAECGECENWLRILHHTDPVLIGEDEAQVANLIRYAKTQGTDTKATLAPLKAVAATVGSSAGMVANVFRQLFSSEVNRGVENARLKTTKRVASQGKARRSA